jgi:hypothetical protein
MIAIITSTIFPQPATQNSAYRATIKSEDRLNQTIETISSLTKNGVNKILLLDNSHNQLDQQTIDLLSPATVYTFNMFQFKNKGLTELHMLLAGLKYIPDDVEIFKISGRYQINKISVSDSQIWDFMGKYSKETKTISTRAYYFKNKAIYEKALLLALNYIYAYQHKIVGPKSLIKIIKNAFKPDLNKLFYESSISIERGIGEAIANLNLNVENLDQLNISGVSGNPTDHCKIIHE